MLTSLLLACAPPPPPLDLQVEPAAITHALAEPAVDFLGPVSARAVAGLSADDRAALCGPRDAASYGRLLAQGVVGWRVVTVTRYGAGVADGPRKPLPVDGAAPPEVVTAALTWTEADRALGCDTTPATRVLVAVDRYARYGMAGPVVAALAKAVHVHDLRLLFADASLADVPPVAAPAHGAAGTLLLERETWTLLELDAVQFRRIAAEDLGATARDLAAVGDIMIVASDESTWSAVAEGVNAAIGAGREPVLGFAGGVQLPAPGPDNGLTGATLTIASEVAVVPLGEWHGEARKTLWAPRDGVLFDGLQVPKVPALR